MKLTLEGIRDTAAWASAGVILPGYDAAEAQRRAVAAPRWVHFSIGNIFRVFLVHRNDLRPRRCPADCAEVY